MSEEIRSKELIAFERWYKDFKGIAQCYPVSYGQKEPRDMWIAWQARAKSAS